jgi:hypothetical protein
MFNNHLREGQAIDVGVTFKVPEATHATVLATVAFLLATRFLSLRRLSRV